MCIFYWLNPEEETLLIWESLPFSAVTLITFDFSSTTEPAAQETISVFTFQLNNAVQLKEGFLTFLEKTVSFGNDLGASFIKAYIKVG